MGHSIPTVTYCSKCLGMYGLSTDQLWGPYTFNVLKSRKDGWICSGFAFRAKLQQTQALTCSSFIPGTYYIRLQSHIKKQRISGPFFHPFETQEEMQLQMALWASASAANAAAAEAAAEAKPPPPALEVAAAEPELSQTQAREGRSSFCHHEWGHHGPSEHGGGTFSSPMGSKWDNI